MWLNFRDLTPVVLLLLIGVAKSSPISASPVPQQTNGGTHFHIIHTNDMHSRFEQTSQLSGTCSASNAAKNNCYGGFARVATLVRTARNGSTPALFLNAGDTYQGTIWFTVHKWKIVAKFLNILQPDAISLGNHEFDNGVEGLVPFLNNVTFPVLAANLNLTDEPDLEATGLAKSTVIDVSGTSVGVIGYLTPETKLIATTDHVIFEDEVEAISKEAKKLKESGVNILIALGHSGITTDQKIAAEVEDIDLVIGGHTNTFLFNGSYPDSEIPAGLYPMPVTQSSGRIVYVVQGFAYTKYVGNLSLTFDSEGELTHIEGNPILLNSSIEQASDVLEELDKWRGEIDKMTTAVVGSTRVELEGTKASCRQAECNLGNLITDAIIDYNLRQYADAEGWTDVAIVMLNGGAIKTGISKSSDNKITTADVFAVLPFGNTAVTVYLTGETILSMLELSVKSLTGNPELDIVEDLAGSFLQFSGLQVTYNLSQPVDSRVVSVRVRCADCLVPTFGDLNTTETYSVIVNDFMFAGGDGYDMLPGLEYKTLAITLADMVIDYLGKHSPVYPAVEGRITFTGDE